jgi:hypothetical protein
MNYCSLSPPPLISHCKIGDNSKLHPPSYFLKELLQLPGLADSRCMELRFVQACIMEKEWYSLLDMTIQQLQGLNRLSSF